MNSKMSSAVHIAFGSCYKCDEYSCIVLQICTVFASGRQMHFVFVYFQIY